MSQQLNLWVNSYQSDEDSSLKGQFTSISFGLNSKEEVSKEEELMVGDLFSQSEEVQEEPVATQEAEETTSNSVS